MALVLADRVKETTTTTGTGTVTLAGAATGYQSFAAIGNGNSTYYCIAGQTGGEWEVGIGTYTASGTTLSRTTVLASSAAGALVTFSAGTKDVFCTYSAAKAVAAGTGYFTDQFAGTFSDGVVIDYSSGNGRISVGAADGIRFYNGGVGGTLLGEALAGGNWDFNGTVTVGTGTPIGGVSNPLVEANGNSNSYVEVYAHNDNTGSSASADLVVYPDNGSDATGWLDIGINSSTFSDAAYSVSTANEGYIFMSAPSGAGKTGDLIIATDSTGSTNAIEVYTGGFTQGKTTPKLIIQNSNSTVGIRTASPSAALHLPAGTATASTAPLKFTSGTNLTTAEAGAVEYDGKVGYFSGEASQRGVVDASQIITLTGNYTTVSGSTALQKLFNAPTNGALTVGGSTTYLFECQFDLSAMSATAGTFSFGFLGTATYSLVRYLAIANKTALTVQTASSHTYGTVATAVVISASNTTATGYAFVKGKLIIGTGGTIIPAFAVSQAAAAVVQSGAYFRLWAVGSNTVQSVGNWA